MCVTIVINRGEKEIKTPRQFKDHFGIEIGGADDEWLDSCICHYNFEEIFKANGIEFKWVDNDATYYIGQLDLVIGDND